MSVIAKMYCTNRREFASGGHSYELAPVCRGEENKEWAAATPAGNLSIDHPVLDELWGSGPFEVLVKLTPDPEGDWDMQSCEFSYGGVQTKFRCSRGQNRYFGFSAQFTINASGATKAMREAFIAGLEAGDPPKFSITVERA